MRAIGPAVSCDTEIGNDAGAADEADGRLQARQAVHRRRADDAAVGFGADANRARLAAIAVPVPELDPHGLRSSTYGFFVCPPRELHPDDERVEPEVGPLAEIGLAENHRAGVAKPRHHERVRGGMIVRQRERTRGVHHPGDVDVVLDQHGNAVQRSAHLAGLALGVERGGLGGGSRIDLDHRIQLRAGIVNLRDAIEIGLRERLGRQLPRRHPIARVGRAQLDDVDRGFSIVGASATRV